MLSTSNNSTASSPNEKVIFKCDQHAANISDKLQKFYKEKDFFDTILIAGNDCIKIPAHKIVLSALSDYFWETFHGIPTTSMANEVKLKEIDALSLQLILDYMYSGSIELSFEKIESILRSSVFLKMKNLTDGCCDYLGKNLNNINCLHWLRLAKKLKLSGLEEKSSILIYTHFEEVTQQPEFLLLTKDELKDLLFNDNTHGKFEEQIFLSLVTWIEFEKLNRQDLLFELLSMIRYQFLTPKFIVENSNLVSKTVENCELILGWLKYHLSPESRTIEQKNLNVVSEPKPKKEQNIQEEIGKLRFIFLNEKKEAEIRSYNRTLKNWSIEKRSHPLLTNKQFNYNLYSNMIEIDENLYIVGGLTDNGRISNCVECVDTKSLLLTDLPPMRVARYKSQLANLNGHLCVFGGYKCIECKHFIDSVEIFNFSTQKWSYLQPPFKPTIRSRIVCHNGILYIFNFRYDCVQCYDVSSNQWTTKKQSIDDNVEDFRMAAADNFVYSISICEKYRSQKNNCVNKKIKVKRFNLSNDTWSDLAELAGNQYSSFIKMVTIVGNQILFDIVNHGLVECNLDSKEFTTLLVFSYNFCILPSKK